MFEVVTETIINIPYAIIIAAVAGFIRSVFGWFENANKDGVIEDFEIKQLYGTVGKYFAYIILLMTGVPSAAEILGLTVSIQEAAGIATALTFMLDVLTSALKSSGK